MRVTEVDRLEGESLSDVEAQLEGRVFHVTRLGAWEAIRECGEIRPNSDGTLPTTFGSSRNSYFRNRGCVSLFDYRALPSEYIKEFRTRCWPFQPAEPGGEGVAVLLLKENIYELLIPWTRSREENAYAEMVVPYVEAGHPGPIGIANVEQVIIVRRTESPNSLAALIRNARRRKSAG